MHCVFLFASSARSMPLHQQVQLASHKLPVTC